MSTCCGRNKVKTTEQGAVQISIAQAERRQYTRECEDCDSGISACSLEKVYGNRGVPLQSAGDLVAFIKASNEQAAYNASLCYNARAVEPQTCINLSTVIRLQ